MVSGFLMPTCRSFFRAPASYARCVFEGIAFVAAKMENEDGLPDIKRVHNQLGRYTDLPVVIVSETLDAKARKALVVQGVPSSFLACRPSLLLAFASTTSRRRRYRRKNYPPGCASGLRHPRRASRGRCAAVLREVAGLTPSDASRALAELDEQVLVVRSKSGRSMLLERERDSGNC